MKKNIEWLKKEIATEMIQLEPNRVERWLDVQYQTLRSVAQKLDQLDELEVLSYEWIDSNSVNASSDGVTEEYVHVDDLENLVIPKQELPVVPKFIAEWIETHLEQGFDLYPVLKKLEDNSRLWTEGYNWYRENTLDFTIAYLTKEYKVEEEPLYYALIKGHELVNDEGEWSTKYWNLWVSGGCVFPADRLADYDDFLTTMSKEEWSECGINDTNADFIKVEEIEE